jgi:putative chitinase
MIRTALQWNTVLAACQVSTAQVARWAPVFSEVITESTFSLGDAEIDDFIGQVAHESQGFTRLEENLNYTTPERLMAVWPSRFRSVREAMPFVRNPIKLANKVYGGRMGNMDSGDGFKFRGRGLIMATGKDNYAMLEAATGIPLVDNPDMLSQPQTALQVSIAWWERKVPDSAMGSIQRVTRAVNGGVTGLSDRISLTRAAHEALA